MSRRLGVRAKVVLAAVGLLSLAVAGCGRGSSDERIASTVHPQPEVTPAGAEAVLAAVRASTAEVVLVNVWATWCQPCREEFPDLLRLRRAFPRTELEVVLVSGDFADQLPQVREFLTDQGVDFPTYLKQGKDMAFIDALSPNWSGALPATFVYDRSRRLVSSWEGKASLSRFEDAVRRALERPAGRGGS